MTLECSTVPRRAPDSARPSGVPLYVHFPFCVVKCTYCDFYSVAEFNGRSTKDQDLDWILELLLREAERRASSDPVTVFLGGGTPSIHSPEALGRFLDRLDDVTGFRTAATEVTMESNPESLDLETAQAAVEGGVQRLSIGVQTFDEQTLELFDRAHGPNDADRAFRAARASGASLVNVDLIYGSPDQEKLGLARDLKRLEDWKPDHVSAYSLAFEKGTLITKWKEQGAILELPEEPARARFLEAREGLAKQGLRAYEVSNFTLNSPCLHNINAWWNGPYIGIGPSAVSSVDGIRFGQARSVNAWKRALEDTSVQLPMAWEEHLDLEARRAESWWLGLRVTEGVDSRLVGDRDWDAGTFLARARIDTARHRDQDRTIEFQASGREAPQDRWDIKLANALADQGWLVREGPRFRVADHAWPVVDALARKFLEGAPALPS